MTTAVVKCPFPVAGGVCGTEVPPRRGPGRPRVYCDDPSHNATARLRIERARPPAVGQETSPLGRALALVDRAYAAADRIRRQAYAAVQASEARAWHAEVETLAARRERDAALAMCDEAMEEVKELRAELARARWRIGPRASTGAA